MRRVLWTSGAAAGIAALVFTANLRAQGEVTVPGGKVVVRSAVPDEAGYLIINGFNFREQQGFVALDLMLLDVEDWTDQRITVKLPDLDPGTYLLTVMRARPNAKYKLTQDDLATLDFAVGGGGADGYTDDDAVEAVAAAGLAGVGFDDDVDDLIDDAISSLATTEALQNEIDARIVGDNALDTRINGLTTADINGLGALAIRNDVTTAEIVNGTILGEDVADGTITADKLAFDVPTGTTSEKSYYPAALCPPGGLAAIGAGFVLWDGSHTGGNNPGVSCVNDRPQRGGAAFPDVFTSTMAKSFPLPADWSNSVNVVLYWTKISGGAGDVVWRIQSRCAGAGQMNPGFTQEDLDPDTAGVQNLVLAAPATNALAVSSSRSLAVSGCDPGEILTLQVSRLGSDPADTLVGSTDFFGVEVTLGR